MPKHNFLAGGLKKSYDYYDLIIMGLLKIQALKIWNADQFGHVHKY